MQESISGSPSSAGSPAPKSKRFFAAFTDLVAMPIGLGLIAGLILFAFPDAVRSVLLVLINIGWLIFRDTVFSPGRHFAWRKPVNLFTALLCLIGSFVISRSPEANPIFLFVLVLLGVAALVIFIFDKGGEGANLRLVSLTSEKVTVGQAVLRNILLIIPFVLVFGYLIEVIFLFIKGDRLADSWAKTRVITA